MRSKYSKEKIPLSDDNRISKIIALMHEYAQEGTKYYSVRQKLLAKGFSQNTITQASFFASYTALLKSYETKPTNEKLKEHFKKFPDDAVLYANAKYLSMEETQDDIDRVARFLIKLVFRTPVLSHLAVPVQAIIQMVIYWLGSDKLYRRYRNEIIVLGIFAIVFSFLIFIVLPASTLGDGFWIA